MTIKIWLGDLASERNTSLSFFSTNVRDLLKEVEGLEKTKDKITKLKKEVEKYPNDEHKKHQLVLARDDAESSVKVLSGSIKALFDGVKGGINLDAILQKPK